MMRNGNRALINDSLHDDLSNMFEDDDDSDDDSDAVEFVNSVKEKQVIESVLAAPNPHVTSVDKADEMERDELESEIHEEDAD